MTHLLLWRKNVPTIVSFLAGYELDAQPYTTLSAALVALSLLKGW